jgi:excisionase family DNA binding protein
MSEPLPCLTVTVEEAARALGISRNGAYAAVKRGEIHTIRVGRKYFVPIAWLEEKLGVAVEALPAAPLPPPPASSKRAPVQHRLRRFTPEEDAILTARYAAYDPTEAIANDLDRDAGTVRQRIFFLGLRRSSHISRALEWAPEHLRAKVHDCPPDEWLAACHQWRDQQREQWRHAEAEEAAQQEARLTAVAAEIDQRLDLTRNQKIQAKRMAGLTLESIARQYDISRERVRQIADPDYVPPISSKRLPPHERLARLDTAQANRRQRLITQAATALFEQWQMLPPEAKAKFRSMIDGNDVE